MPNYLNYPDCAAAASHPLFIGDGYCDHGYYNTLECGFDGGDCEPWNAEFPNCKTEYLADIGTGSCFHNYGHNTAECDFDGGNNCYYFNFMKKYPNCIVYDILRIGDGRCDGSYNTAECGVDLGDCEAWNAEFPNCKTDYLADIGIGDDVCDGGFDLGDCGNLTLFLCGRLLEV